MAWHMAWLARVLGAVCWALCGSYGLSLLAIVKHGVLRPLEPCHRKSLTKALSLRLLESAEMHLLDIPGARASEGALEVKKLGDTTREEHAEEGGNG